MSPWIAAAGAFVVSLDSMMNIAFPAIAAAFAVPADRIRWVVICYVLTYALTAFAGGAAADRLGHTPVFRAGVGLSVAAFVMGGTAPSFGWLLVARIVQGVAGGLVYGTAPALSTAGVPAGLRGRRLGFLSGAIALAGALGPLAAGLLVQAFGWRAVYHVRAPLALGVFVGTAAARPFRAAPRPAGPQPRDGLRSAPPEPLARARTAAARPMVTLADVTRAPVLRASALSFVARASIFAIWLLVPFYLVDARGLGPAVGGVLFMLTPLGTALAAPLAGRLADRVGAAGPAVAGLLVEGLGLGLLACADGGTSLGLIGLALLTAGFGLGFFEVPNMASIMAAFPVGQQGAAGGLAFLARTLGVVAGVSILAEIFATRRTTVGFIGAFTESLLIAALAVAVAALFAVVGGRGRR
jgi:MFS family permease